jgi:large conductance mechanosensitive channel
MLKEFKEFALKGNVMDMAVGIIIGAAFGTIVKSLVSDVIMPPIGILMGDVDFADMFIVLKAGSAAVPDGATLAQAKELGAVTLNWGAFLNTVISFVIVAFSIFVLVNAMNAAKRKEEAAPPAPTEKACPRCCSKIALAATRCPHCTSDVPAAA